MMTRALVLVLALAAGSCGSSGDRKSDDDSGGGGGNGGGGALLTNFDLDLYCGQTAGAACQLADKCNNQTLFNDRHLDADGCREALKAECVDEGQRWARAVDDGAVDFEPVQFRDCLDGLAQKECNESAQGWGFLSCTETASGKVCDRFFFRNALEQSCLDIFAGKVAEDDTCYHDTECAEGWCNEEAVCPGKCRPHLQRGDICSLTAEACGPGLTCWGTQNKKCKPFAQEGEDCVSSGPGQPEPLCEPPLQCLSSTVNRLYGTCVKPRERGEPCGNQEGQCLPDSFCSHKTATAPEGSCEAFQDETTECDDALATPRPCGVGLHCFGPGVDPGFPGRPGTKGDCRPYPANEGDACIRNPNNCMDAYCVDAAGPRWEGYCLGLRANGEDCSHSYQCDSKLCGASPSGLGQICKPLHEGQRCIREAR